MRKALKICTILIALILMMATNVLAAEVLMSTDVQKDGKEYLITLKIDKLTVDVEGIMVFSARLDYDREDFEVVKEEDITTKNDWGKPNYNEDSGILLLWREDFTKGENEEIVEIKLKQKENPKNNKSKITFFKIQATDSKEALKADDITIEIELRNAGTAIYVVVGALALLVVIVILKNTTKRRKVK